MTDIPWIDLRGYCEGPHPEKRDGQWRYPKGRTAIRQFIKSNGAVNYELVCMTSGCRFKSSPIPSDAAATLVIAQKLPVLETRYADKSGHVCCYDGCESTSVEWHHFAPRNTFGGEADRFPIHPLCPDHHRHWHRTMDGYRWTKSSALFTSPQRDPEDVALELLQEELGARRIGQ